MSCKEKDRKLPSPRADAGSGGSALEVQNRGSPSPGRQRGAPQNFVWRRGASRRQLSSSSTASTDDGDMAVDVPVLRECFDPWRRDRPDEDGHDGQAGRCQGCDKISRARAAAAAIAAASTTVAMSPPQTPTRGKFPESFCFLLLLGVTGAFYIPQFRPPSVSFWSSLPPIFRQPPRSGSLRAASRVRWTLHTPPRPPRYPQT